jgi:hypothetical protein
MAHVIHGPFHGASLSQVDAEKSADDTRRTLLTGTTIAVSILLLLLLAGVAAYLVAHKTSQSATTQTHTAPLQAKAASLARPDAPLGGADLKALQARDEYTASLTKLLHHKLPEYKRVTIYADNWAGSHAPSLTAPRDLKTRTGDNLMMVFWSPDSGTARSLGDFTKSKAAQEAVNLGFEEFQFVDPGAYCFATVAPNTGVGPVTCGIR